METPSIVRVVAGLPGKCLADCQYLVIDRSRKDLDELYEQFHQKFPHAFYRVVGDHREECSPKGYPVYFANPENSGMQVDDVRVLKCEDKLVFCPQNQKFKGLTENNAKAARSTRGPQHELTADRIIWHMEQVLGLDPWPLKDATKNDGWRYLREASKDEKFLSTYPGTSQARQRIHLPGCTGGTDMSLILNAKPWIKALFNPGITQAVETWKIPPNAGATTSEEIEPTSSGDGKPSSPSTPPPESPSFLKVANQQKELEQNAEETVEETVDGEDDDKNPKYSIIHKLLQQKKAVQQVELKKHGIHKSDMLNFAADRGLGAIVLQKKVIDTFHALKKKYEKEETESAEENSTLETKAHDGTQSDSEAFPKKPNTNNLKGPKNKRKKESDSESDVEDTSPKKKPKHNTGKGSGRKQQEKVKGKTGKEKKAKTIKEKKGKRSDTESELENTPPANTSKNKKNPKSSKTKVREDKKTVRTSGRVPKPRADFKPG